jgi:hypothetical protein
MFHLRTLLFIPGYVTVTLYRILASPEGGSSLIVMIRECYLRSLMYSAYDTISYTSFDHQHLRVVLFVIQCF